MIKKFNPINFSDEIRLILTQLINTQPHLVVRIKEENNPVLQALRQLYSSGKQMKLK
jgi:antitoxin component of RelBE/YafQ-DinJ toxin-antitoxin module